MKYYPAIALFIIAAIYARSETSFFGNNGIPQSWQEVIADGIILLISAAGWVCIAIARKQEGSK